METKSFKLPFIGVCILAVVLLCVVVRPSKKVSWDYKEMSVWQLVDAKLQLVQQISWLDKKVFDIDTIICWKEVSLCTLGNEKQNNPTTSVESPTTQLNKALNLQ